MDATAFALVRDNNVPIIVCRMFGGDIRRAVLGEAVGTEIDESDLSVDFTIGELWRFVHDAEENADL